MTKRTLTLDEASARAEEGGGKARAERHKRLGRMLARERLRAFFDDGSMTEIGRYVTHDLAHKSDQLAANLHPGDGVVTALGTVDGRAVAGYAHDATVLRGSIGSAGARKIIKLLHIAKERGLPVVTFADSDGARVPEGMDAVLYNGELMQRTVELQGKVPQITVVCGLCVGAAAYTAVLTDVVAMVKEQSFMFVTGPKVTKVATGEDVPIEELGGTTMHLKDTGACHAVLDSEADAIAWARTLLGYADARLRPSSSSSSSSASPAVVVTAPSIALADIVPDEQRKGYDGRKAVAALFDAGSVVELGAAHAPTLLTFLARLDGAPVAVLASQPLHGGVLDGVSSQKGAAHILRALAWGLPVITLVDTPGYRPGRREEQAGLLPLGKALIEAYGRAKDRVPLLCLILRKSFGGGSVLSFAADVRLALPHARVAPMGVDAAMEVELGALLDDASAEDRAARDRFRDEWLNEHDHVWSPAEKGYIDEVVEPGAARAALARALRSLG